MQGIMNGLNNMSALLAHGRNIAANGTERIGSRVCAEGARNFLFEFDHAHIAFGEIVVEWNAEVMSRRCWALQKAWVQCVKVR